MQTAGTTAELIDSYKNETMHGIIAYNLVLSVIQEPQMMLCHYIGCQRTAGETIFL